METPVFRLRTYDTVTALCDGGFSRHVDLEGSRDYAAGERVVLHADLEGLDSNRDWMRAEVLMDLGAWLLVRACHSYHPRPRLKWFDQGDVFFVMRAAVFIVET